MSAVLMTSIRARVAGVPEVVLCSPPTAGATVAPGILAAAALAGVDEVYRIGGAQAVAAMAYGTESVRAVDVIVGPGGLYTIRGQSSRSLLRAWWGVPGSFAGPSEVVVIADDKHWRWWHRTCWPRRPYEDPSRAGDDCTEPKGPKRPVSGPMALETEGSALLSSGS